MNAMLDRFKGFLIRQRERIRTLWCRSPVLAPPVETFIVFVGTLDERRQVTFEGRKLAYRTYSHGNKRVCETLYENRDRLLVHIQTLHRVVGLRTEYELRELSESELRTEFPELDRLRSPLRLEEALT